MVSGQLNVHSAEIAKDKSEAVIEQELDAPVRVILCWSFLDIIQQFKSLTAEISYMVLSTFHPCYCLRVGQFPHLYDCIEALLWLY